MATKYISLKYYLYKFFFATRWADLIKNMPFLFSFHISLSWFAIVPRLICLISHTVLGMNVWESNCRCHCLVSGLKRSHTLIFLSTSGLSCGGCGSHLWSSILMLLPSSTFHTVAARIRPLSPASFSTQMRGCSLFWPP